jgi:hypothetical protein
MGISVSLCVHIYLENCLLYLFFMLLPCSIAPALICASHSVTGFVEVPAYGAGAVNFVLVGDLCYLKLTPYHNHY